MIPPPFQGENHKERRDGSLFNSLLGGGGNEGIFRLSAGSEISSRTKLGWRICAEKVQPTDSSIDCSSWCSSTAALKSGA